MEENNIEIHSKKKSRFVYELLDLLKTFFNLFCYCLSVYTVSSKTCTCRWRQHVSNTKR